MTTLGHFVSGKAVAGNSGRTGPVYDPATGEKRADAALASAAEHGKTFEDAKGEGAEFTMPTMT